MSIGKPIHKDSECFHFNVADICRSCSFTSSCYKPTRSKCIASGGPQLDALPNSTPRDATSIKDGRELAYSIKTKYRVITWLLKRVCDRDSSLYHTFAIKKRGRSGKMRTITAPDKYLKEIQKKILKNVLYQFQPLDCVTAFVPGKNVIKNAAQHMAATPGSVDIKDFFDTISSQRVYGLFRSIGFNKRVSGIMTALMTWDGKVPQGAPTSPWIANAIFHRGDKKILSAAGKLGFSYTRYADDITYSQLSGFSKGKNIAFTEIVKRIVEEEGFKPNDDKTKVATNYVTGLSVSGDKPNIPYDKFHEVRQSIHKAYWNGIASEASYNNAPVGLFTQRINGVLQWFTQVNPSRPGLSKMVEKWELAKKGIRPSANQSNQSGAGCAPQVVGAGTGNAQTN